MNLKSRSKERFAVILILGLAVFLRLADLLRSLSLDEILYSTNFSLSTLKSLIKWTLVDSSLPFYRIFMFFWIRLFGDAALSVRMPSFLSGVLSIFLTYKIARIIYNEKVALFSSFLLCASGVHIWYSGEATPYAMLLALSLLAIFFYHKTKSAPAKSSWYVFYFLSLFAAVFTHYSVLAYLALISLFALFRKDENSRKKILAINASVLGLLLLFLAIRMTRGNFRALGYNIRPFNFFEFWMLFFNWFAFSNSIWNIRPYEANLSAILQKPAMLFAQLFVLSVFINGLAASLPARDKKPALDGALYIFSLPAVILLAGLVTGKDLYVERYLLIALPFFYMVLARGALKITNRNLKLVSIVVLTVFSLTALASFFQKKNEWTVSAPSPDWKSAARYFDTESEIEKTPLVIYAMSPPMPLVYHETKIGEMTENGGTLGEKMAIYSCKYDDAESLYRKLSKDKVKFFYFLEKKQRPWNVDDLFKEVLKDPRFQLARKTSFNGLEIYKFAVL